MTVSGMVFPWAMYLPFPGMRFFFLWMNVRVTYEHGWM
jgi:hypothetical protein